MVLLTFFVLALAQQPVDVPVRDNLKLEGTVRDETGALMAGLLVILRIPDKPLLLTVTDEVGTYRISSLTSGKYELFVFAPDYVTLKTSWELVRSVSHDHVLKVIPVSSCACVQATPDPTIPDRLRSAMSRLRQVALRMEDLKQADLDQQRHELIGDFRWLNVNAIPALQNALLETNRQARINAAVVLFDLSSGSSDHKPVDISRLFFFLGRAAMDSDKTLSQYARATLESALK